MVTAKALWQDYLFLTKEIERFITKKEFDLCFELLNQREILQSQLDAINDDFRYTVEGKQLLTEIRTRNQLILNAFRAALSLMKQQHAISSAYEGYSSSDPVGYRLDHKR